MPLDDYDDAHHSRYDVIIHIYADDEDIENIVFQSVGCHDNNVLNTIHQLRNALNILNYRIITNIGARCFIYDDDNIKTVLLQIWRGHR